MTREAKRLVALVTLYMQETTATQTDVARLLGVHPSYINKLLAGEREGVGAELIGSAIRVFSVDCWYFFDDFPDGTRTYRDYPIARTRMHELAAEVAKILRDDEDTSVTQVKTRSPRR